MKVSQGYTRTQIRLHWAVVALVTLQFIFHDGISHAYRDGMRAGELVITLPAAVHFATGGAIFLLGVLRLLARRENGAPAHPQGGPAWQAALARTTHVVLYLLLLTLPIAGAIGWGGPSELAAEAHETMTGVLLAVIALHVAGALQGQFVRKDGTLYRMIRARN